MTTKYLNGEGYAPSAAVSTNDDAHAHVMSWTFQKKLNNFLILIVSLKILSEFEKENGKGMKSQKLQRQAIYYNCIGIIILHNF